jgi:sugar lactone lactonase YvrE
MPFVNLRFAILLFCLGTGLAADQQYMITTVAGGRSPATPLIGVSPVGIYSDLGVAADSQGNVYFSDNNCCVWKLDHNGVVTRVAGQWNQKGYTGDGGLAVNATLNKPGNIAADGTGNLYVFDVGNGMIRRISPDGDIGKLVDAAAWSSSEFVPSVAVDPAGSLYYAYCDLANYSKGRCSQTLVHKITSDGTITTYAGGGTGNPGDGGPATGVNLLGVSALAYDSQGNLYISAMSSQIIDNHGLVIKVRPDGSNVLVAGNGSSPNGVGVGDGGPATEAPLYGPSSMAVDSAGNLYLTDDGNTLRKISPDGIITTVADVAASSLAVDGEGNLLIGGGGVLRKLTPDGTLTTILTANPTYGDGGPASLAQVSARVLATDPAGNLYVGGRKITPDGTITTIAGGGTNPPADGMLATQVQMAINGETVDLQGNLYISDYDARLVYKVSPAGTLTVIAGGGTTLPGSGIALNAYLYDPAGLALDAAGNLYIANTGFGVIQKVTPDGAITTVAGTGFSCCGESGDGGPALQAQISNPSGVAVDASGNIYILDGDATIRKVTPDGIIHTVVSWDSQVTNPDGTTATADILVDGLALDATGNVFFTSFDNVVRELKTDGTILNIAGNGTAGYSGDGGPAMAAQLNLPQGVAVDAKGRIYVGDSGNQVVRALIPSATAPLLALNMTHSGSVSPGQTSVSWTLVVSNSVGGATTSGTVSVTDFVPGGLTLASMSGPGWSCSGASCTRSDALAAGASYPPITVTANPGGSAYGQAMNEAAVSGGGSVMSASAQDLLTLPVCGVTLTFGGQVVPAAGGTFYLGVSAASTCAWTVSADQTWVMYFVKNEYGSVFPSGTPYGSGQIAFTSQQNNGPARTAYLTIGDQVFRILQEATPPVGLQAIGSLAHLTSGGGWRSDVTLVNGGKTPATARLDFFDDNGLGLQLPWSFPESFFAQAPIQAASFQTILNPYALTVQQIERDNATSELPGSALFSSDGGASGFIVFEYLPTGQQAVVPLETRNAPSYVLAFDNTGDLQTGVAIANVSTQDATLSVIVRDETGRPITTHSESLWARGHASFMLTKYPETAGIRGTVEVFTPTGGRISVLGLRVNHGIAITTLPVSATGNAGGGTLAQVAVQGGWQTTFTLVNTGATAATATLKFFDDSGAPLALPLTSPSLGALGPAATLKLPLAAGASVVIETQGDDAAPEVTGSAQLDVDGGQVSDFAIFRYNPTQQEAAVPPASTSISNLLVFDNTNGLATGVAVANPGAQPLSATVTARDQTGAVLGTGTIQLPAFGHRQFMLTDAENGGFAQTQNLRGTVEFTPPSGTSLAVLGIRATDAGVITSIPVVAK